MALPAARPPIAAPGGIGDHRDPAAVEARRTARPGPAAGVLRLRRRSRRRPRPRRSVVQTVPAGERRARRAGGDRCDVAPAQAAHVVQCPRRRRASCPRPPSRRAPCRSTPRHPHRAARCRPSRGRRARNPSRSLIVPSSSHSSVRHLRCYIGGTVPQSPKRQLDSCIPGLRIGKLPSRWRGRGPKIDGCGIAHASDLLGQRWALLVVRELLLGPKRFTDLRAGIPGHQPERARPAPARARGVRDRQPPQARAAGRSPGLRADRVGARAGAGGSVARALGQRFSLLPARTPRWGRTRSSWR